MVTYSACHILVKHTGSRRLASWKDPNGDEIKKRTPQAAKEILSVYIAELKAAEDLNAKFMELAKTASDCGSARDGGSLGQFGSGDMMKEFEDATAALNVGEMSGIVDTASGSHIILRTA